MKCGYMKNKGFTLVELLAVIIVLALITTIGVVGVSSVINNSKQKVYNQQVANIIKAAKEWSLENTDKLPEKVSCNICVSLDMLQKSGIFTEIPKNPASNGEMLGGVLIGCKDSECNSYKYEYSSSVGTTCEYSWTICQK